MSISRAFGHVSLPIASALLKMAELPEPPGFSEAAQDPPTEGPPVTRPILHALKATLAPAAAFGVGTAAGYGAQLGVEKLVGKQLSPARLRMAAPVLGGAMGLAYNQYKAREQQELRRAIEAHQNRSARAVPTQ